MGEEEVEEARKRRMTERQKQLEAKKAEEQLKLLLRKAIDELGYERMMNVRLSNEELFMMASQNILSAYQKLGRTITDGEVLLVLRALKQRTQREGTITFERK